MNSLPGPLSFLPHEAVTQRSRWVHALDLTQPNALPGGSDLQMSLQPVEMGGQQRVDTSKYFCTMQVLQQHPENSLQKKWKRWEQETTKQTVLSFLNIQQKPSRNSPLALGFPQSRPTELHLLPGERTGKPSLLSSPEI